MDDQEPPIDNPEPTAERELRRNQRGGIIASLVNLVFGFIIAVIALRVLFLLLGANPANGLVDSIYGLSAPLIAPFAGMFGVTEAMATQARLDLPAIVALVVYGLIAALVNGALGYSQRRYVS